MIKKYIKGSKKNIKYSLQLLKLLQTNNNVDEIIIFINNNVYSLLDERFYLSNDNLLDLENAYVYFYDKLIEKWHLTLFAPFFIFRKNLKMFYVGLAGRISYLNSYGLFSGPIVLSWYPDLDDWTRCFALYYAKTTKKIQKYNIKFIMMKRLNDIIYNEEEKEEKDYPILIIDIHINFLKDVYDDLPFQWVAEGDCRFWQYCDQEILERYKKNFNNENEEQQQIMEKYKEDPIKVTFEEYLKMGYNEELYKKIQRTRRNIRIKMIKKYIKGSKKNIKYSLQLLKLLQINNNVDEIIIFINNNVYSLLDERFYLSNDDLLDLEDAYADFYDKLTENWHLMLLAPYDIFRINLKMFYVGLAGRISYLNSYGLFSGPIVLSWYPYEEDWTRCFALYYAKTTKKWEKYDIKFIMMKRLNRIIYNEEKTEECYPILILDIHTNFLKKIYEDLPFQWVAEGDCRFWQYCDQEILEDYKKNFNNENEEQQQIMEKYNKDPTKVTMEEYLKMGYNEELYKKYKEQEGILEE